SSLPKSKMGGAATISEVAVWREFFDILAYWFKFGITPLSHLVRFFLTPSPARPLGGQQLAIALAVVLNLMQPPCRKSGAAAIPT
ncbi:MAG: hypothetical protein KBT28_12240, partial [Bacteroidales bacterium]|nr:hypothetical protein [Candidatus Colimorpha merdihippi]